MIVVVMGVCGSGKTTVGRKLAARTGWTFIEGDDLHPGANRRKMASGKPLTDEDRWPWLDRIAARMRQADAEGESAVVACSALRQAYRDRLRDGSAEVRFLHLTGDEALLRDRLARRRGHYMPAELLDSQLAVLEPAGQAEDVRDLDVARDVESIVQTALEQLAR